MKSISSYYLRFCKRRKSKRILALCRCEYEMKYSSFVRDIVTGILTIVFMFDNNEGKNQWLVTFHALPVFPQVFISFIEVFSDK